MSNEEEDFASDSAVKIILASAQASIDSSKDTDHRQLLKTKISNILCEAAYIDQMEKNEVFHIASSLLQVGFEIGKIIAGEEQSEAALRELQAQNGRRSGQVRRERAKTGWKVHATDLAIKRRSNLSQKDLAAAILADWHSTEEFVPKFDAVLNHVKDLQQEGRLPPKMRHRTVR